jgi:hypothetical protein
VLVGLSARGDPDREQFVSYEGMAPWRDAVVELLSQISDELDEAVEVGHVIILFHTAWFEFLHFQIAQQADLFLEEGTVSIHADFRRADAIRIAREAEADNHAALVDRAIDRLAQQPPF